MILLILISFLIEQKDIVEIAYVKRSFLFVVITVTKTTDMHQCFSRLMLDLTRNHIEILKYDQLSHSHAPHDITSNFISETVDENVYIKISPICVNYDQIHEFLIVVKCQDANNIYPSLCQLFVNI